MGPTPSVIPARSHQQALDWSLVLMSQGIENTIERNETDDGWQVVVDGNESQRALKTLRQYRIENRPVVWRRKLPWEGLLFDWRNLGCFAVLVGIFILENKHYPYLIEAGVMDTKAIRAGEWWRLFTAITLHRDIAHLASNIGSGIVLLGLAMGSFGPGIGLLAAYLAGLAGNLARLCLYTGTHASLGASGMLFGALGLLSGQTLGFLRAGLTPRQVAIRSVLSGFLLLVLFGLDPDTDVFAHAGGFVSGVLIGALLAVVPNRLSENAPANRIAALVCVIMVCVSWWAALGRA